MDKNENDISSTDVQHVNGKGIVLYYSIFNILYYYVGRRCFGIVNGTYFVSAFLVAAGLLHDTRPLTTSIVDYKKFEETDYSGALERLHDASTSQS